MMSRPTVTNRGASSGPSDSGRFIALLLLAASVIAAVSLRYVHVHDSKELHHDGGISLLAATGHLAAYAPAVYGGLTERWVEAAEWKRLIRSEPGFAFRRIGRDLSAYDIHPPLYFWLLHVWMKWTGDDLPGVFMLNAVLGGLTALFIFLLANRILVNATEASVVAALWAVSPGACLVSEPLRQYEIFCLLSVALIWTVFRVAGERALVRFRD